jgi:MFS family permease
MISFLGGIYYYGNTYFLPIYFQITLEPPVGALLSAALLQALLLPQIATALSAGFAVERLGHYNPILWLGYGVYVIGAGVQTTFTRTTAQAYIVGILFIEGFGIGWTLQTALVAAQAHAPPKDRAVVTGIRNLARFTGGAFGLAISSAIMNNLISSRLRTSGLPTSITDQIRGAEFNVPAGMTAAQREILLDAEMSGLKGVFWFLLGVSIMTFLLSLGVSDHGLPGDKKVEEKAEETQVEKTEDGPVEADGTEENTDEV